MAVPSYKSVAFAQQLANKLNTRLNGTLTFAILADTDGQPYLTAGSGAAGAENVIIKLINYLTAQNAAAATATAPTPYQDGLGLAASPYSPTILRVITEAAGGSSLGSGAQASGTVTISSGSGTETATIGGTAVSVTWATSDTATATALATALNANAKVAALGTATASTNTVVFKATPGLGTAGNSIALTVSGTGMTATGSGYLAGGTNAAPATGNSIVPMKDLFAVIGDVVSNGGIADFWLSPAGSAPTTTNGVLQTTYRIEVWNPTMTTN